MTLVLWYYLDMKQALSKKKKKKKILKKVILRY